MKEPIYKCLDVMDDNIVYFTEFTKFGKQIVLKTATQEQLEFLYKLKHPFIYIYKDPKNGDQN